MRFYFDRRNTYAWANGAIGHYPQHRDSIPLGPFAKVTNCPIDGTELVVTAYATWYSDTLFSVPAETRYKGQYIGGYLYVDGDSLVFRPMPKYCDRLGIAE